jgi:hypothetical protein
MAKAEASVEELVGMIERGELRLPEMQRRYVWRSTRVRDLLDSLYRGYPSGAILLWETDEAVPLQEFAVAQQRNPYQSTRLLLDGQQRLTSLSAVIRSEPVSGGGRKRPIELLFNLEHPDHLAVVTEVNEEGDDEDEDESEEDELIDDEADSSADELQKRFERMTFVVVTKKLGQLPHWVKVSDVFKSESDRPFLRRAGITDFDDPRSEKYSQRLARLRGIRKYVYRMDILERTLSYDEVTEIFVRVNSLGAKLRSSDLALAQITAKWRGALKTFQAFQEQCANVGFDLDLGIHLKNLVTFATGQSRFLTVSSLPLETLKQAWKECVPGMEFALNFLKSNGSIDSLALLSSPFLLVTLGYYGHKRKYQIGAEEANRLRHWVLLANAAADDTGLPLAGTESPRAHLEVAASRRHPSSRVCDPHRANRSDPEFLPLPRRRERSGAPAMWLQNPGIFSCITVGTYLNLLRSLRKNFLAAPLSRRRWTKMSRMLPS